MTQHLLALTLLILILPLLGSLAAGILGNRFGRVFTHSITIAAVALSFILATYLAGIMLFGGQPTFEATVYQWATSGAYHFDVGILVDRLSATMIFIVTFISLMVHIYTIGYMADDPGYARFFSYVSLFTFAMLALVLANNFLLMFFGWEGVGLVSYLLIGFWFERESAVFGSLKAFLVNRIGDIGFILAMAAVLLYFNSFNYHDVFNAIPTVLNKTIPLGFGAQPTVITVIAVLLFISAMAKSAQVPLHVWLPESMEGPTPISALIHAATMVTAGIYLVARFSPLYEYAPAALSLILVVGGTTALFLGLVALTQNDIKRVIAYSTLSQLGYMTVALGASAYDVAIFHLVTHAFFKALLFLAAGSVIVALHHEQDMRRMGGLAAFMPITYLTFLIGALALSAIQPFAGFYSKDMIIEAVHASTTPGAHYAYLCVLLGAFITPLYIFRALFLTFHGERRHADHPVFESPWVILVPLIGLAVPSIVSGGMLIGPMLFHQPHLLGNSIFVLPEHDTLFAAAQDYQGATVMALQATRHLTFWLALAGIVVAWLTNLAFPQLSSWLTERGRWIYFILVKKYGFDDFNQLVFVRGTRRLGNFFYQITDLRLIDGIFVNGSGRLIRYASETARRLQTGYLYHYAFAMLLGLGVFLVWFLVGF